MATQIAKEEKTSSFMDAREKLRIGHERWNQEGRTKGKVDDLPIGMVPLESIALSMREEKSLKSRMIADSSDE
jgi:hypothetical protein